MKDLKNDILTILHRLISNKFTNFSLIIMKNNIKIRLTFSYILTNIVIINNY